MKLKFRDIEHFWNLSLFILDEYIQGRHPNEEELLQAQTIKKEGLKQNPMLWKSVDDQDTDDVIISDDGKFYFIDRGHFHNNKISERQNELILRDLMRHFLGATDEDFLKEDNDGWDNEYDGDLYQHFDF